MRMNHDEAQVATSANPVICFDLAASAAYFDRMGQTSVARSLRERAADLLAETVRLQALLNEVLPRLSDSARFPQVSATEKPGLP